MVAGIAHFGAISLTQIPGDPDSVKGSNARGVYWTKPDQIWKRSFVEMLNRLMSPLIQNL